MAKDKLFSWPTKTERTTILGRTGSGKTQMGAYILSQSPFHEQPYIIFDYKGDELLGSIDRIREIGLNELPKQPGVYIVRPGITEIDAVEKYLWQIWERERIGLYIDEAYMLPNSGPHDRGALQAIYTQGRSLKIPVIALSQRPAWISGFLYSEADHFAVFHLNDDRDEKTVQRFFPRGSLKNADRLEDYNSRWYSVKSNSLYLMKPVPDADTIRNLLNDRLLPKRRHI